MMNTIDTPDISAKCQKCGKVFNKFDTAEKNAQALRMHKVRSHSKRGKEGALLGAANAAKIRLAQKSGNHFQLTPAKLKKALDFEPQINFCPNCGEELAVYHAAAKMRNKQLLGCPQCREDLLPYNTAILHREK